MSMLTLHRESQAIALPEPRVAGAISIRLAVQGDLKFIDELQREHSRMVGWFPTKQIEGNISKGHVLIAEEIGMKASPEGHEGMSESTLHASMPHASMPRSVAYCISNDRYFKRDDCGIIYQLNVAPTKQRGLIGASLIKAVFDRAAYGCKLFCCWCAQDLQANHFWESLGFVPLAFRTGSRKAGAKKEPRIHIFWQRRIREGDMETAYWFPAETSGGAVKENRLVLPIPPGTHWSDAKPAILPGMENVNVLPPGAVDPTAKKSGGRPRNTPKIAKPRVRPKGGLWFSPTPGNVQAKEAQKAAAPKPKRPRQKFRNDPKLVSAARELRDRYMEEINAGLVLPPSACGKYDVSRQLEAAPSGMKIESAPLLEAA